MLNNFNNYAKNNHAEKIDNKGFSQHYFTLGPLTKKQHAEHNSNKIKSKMHQFVQMGNIKTRQTVIGERK